MSLQLFPTNFPPQNTAVVDNNNTVTTPWMAFFRALFNRTGQGSGSQFSTNSSIIPTGGTQTTATVLSDDWNAVSSAGFYTLPALTMGQQVTLFNNSGGNINVFPPVGATITFLGVNAGLNNFITLAATDFIIAYYFSDTDIQVA